MRDPDCFLATDFLIGELNCELQHGEDRQSP